nr:unnamed protein product [Callosobruchus chinensis]
MKFPAAGKLKVPIAVLAAIQVVFGNPVAVTVGLPERPERYHPIYSLHHAQDKLGQYVYGYATPTSAKSETKSIDGVTRGGYSYIDSDGILQTVHYTADALNGFRVAATNLPRDLPDVAYAKAKHIADFYAIKADHDQIAAIRAVHYSNPVAVPVANVPYIPEHQQLPQPVTDLPEVVHARNEHLATLNAAYANAHHPVIPLPTQDLPEVLKARAEHLAAFEQIRARDEAIRAAEISLSPVPEHLSGGVVPIKTVQSNYVTPDLPVAQSAPVAYTPAIIHAPSAAQFQTQDHWGQYSYGYVGPLRSHSESRTADGVTRGGYSYIDANGIIQTVHYVADAVHGFRVAASNLPIDIHHVAKA